MKSKQKIKVVLQIPNKQYISDMTYPILSFLVLLSGTFCFGQDTVRITDLDKKHPTDFSQTMLYLYQGKPYSGVATKGSSPVYDRLQHYQNGQIHGLSQAYYKNGQLKEQCNYIFGRRDGELIYYYENGQQMSSMRYETGRVVDTTRTWYDNGQPKSIEIYTPGKNQVDEYDIWFKNGQKQYEVRLNSQQVWHENGKLKVKMKLLDGKPNGKIKYRDEAGKVVKIEIWEKGEKIEEIEK